MEAARQKRDAATGRDYRHGGVRFRVQAKVPGESYLVRPETGTTSYTVVASTCDDAMTKHLRNHAQ